MITSRPRLVWIWLFSVSLGPNVSHATIYLCTDAEGNRLYTDHGCAFDPEAGPKHFAAEIYTPDEQPALAFAPLTESERQRLQQLKDRNQTSKQRSGYTSGQQVPGRRDPGACQTARTALKQLRQKRRAGYKLDEAADMEAEEAHWKAQRRRAC